MTTATRAATRHHPTSAQPVDARQPISRGGGARRRVLRAALDVLDEDGLPGFTMEAVARRAEASKATLYVARRDRCRRRRHWGCR
jgi:AcrR family transcriptional regulator